MRKTCFKCGESQDIECFYAHPMMADGHLGKCKTCTKRDVQQDYRLKRDAKREYEKKRSKTEKRRQAKARYQRERRRRNPEKSRANRLVNYAVRSGKLVPQPCERQPCDQKAQAHHEDYSKPLDVNWLCFKHHREHHGQLVD